MAVTPKWVVVMVQTGYRELKKVVVGVSAFYLTMTTMRKRTRRQERYVLVESTLSSSYCILIDNNNKF